MDLRRELAKAKGRARRRARAAASGSQDNGEAAAPAPDAAVSAELGAGQRGAEAEQGRGRGRARGRKEQNQGRRAKLAGFETRGKAAAKRAKDAQALLDKASEREKILVQQEDAAAAAAAADALRADVDRRAADGSLLAALRGRGASSTRGFGGTSKGRGQARGCCEGCGGYVG